MKYTNLEEMYTSVIGRYILQNENNTTNDMAKGGILLISAQELTEMELHYEVLNEFVLFRRKIEELRTNYKLLLNADITWEKKLEKLHGQDLVQIQEKIFIDINRRLNNFIVSFKTLMADILEKHKLPKIFGADSDELKAFKLKTNDWYNNQFSYRFFTRLRDYSVHYNIPLQIANFKVNFDKEKEKQLTVRMNLSFRKSTLLEFKEIKRIFEKEFEQFDNEFELKPLLKDFNFLFDELYQTIVKISGNRYLTPAMFFKRQIERFTNPITVSFGTVVSDGVNVNPQTKVINSLAVEEILKYK